MELGVPAAVGLAAVVAYSRTVFGIWSLTPGYTAKGFDYASRVTAGGAPHAVRDALVNVAGAFVSTDRGLLLVSPVVLVLLFRLVPAWQVAPLWAKASAAGGVVYLALQLRLDHFTGGLHFYGYRLTLEPLALWTPLLWLAWRDRVRGSGWERAVRAACCLSVGNQVLGAVFVYPDGVVPEWHHMYFVDVFDPDLYPRACQVVVLVTVAAAALTMLWRRRAPIASPQEALPAPS